MRLIDADEVKALVPKKLRRLIDGSEVEVTTYKYEVIKAINTAKTINAIPIEWIEKWLDKTTGTRDGEDISQLPEQLKFAIGMINLMEMEWEKENEID